MLDVYSLNPKILPGPPISDNDHRRRIQTGVAVAILALLVGLVFWLGASQSKDTFVDEQARIRAEIISRINTPPAQQASAEDKAQIIQRIAIPPAHEASAEEKAEIIKRLTTN